MDLVSEFHKCKEIVEEIYNNYKTPCHINTVNSTNTSWLNAPPGSLWLKYSVQYLEMVINNKDEEFLEKLVGRKSKTGKNRDRNSNTSDVCSDRDVKDEDVKVKDTRDEDVKVKDIRDEDVRDIRDKDVRDIRDKDVKVSDKKDGDTENGKYDTVYNPQDQKSDDNDKIQRIKRKVRELANDAFECIELINQLTLEIDKHKSELFNCNEQARKLINDTIEEKSKKIHMHNTCIGLFAAIHNVLSVYNSRQKSSLKQI